MTHPRGLDDGVGHPWYGDVDDEDPDVRARQVGVDDIVAGSREASKHGIEGFADRTWARLDCGQRRAADRLGLRSDRVHAWRTAAASICQSLA
jgi:hypothetical protein